VADLHELFVNEFDTPQTRCFQQLDLRLDEQIEGDLGHEQTRTRTSRVSDGSPDILRRQVVSGVDRFQCLAEDVVEDVVDTGASAELFGRDLERCTFDRGDEITRKFRHQFQDQ
jgi:hypothetical protein